MYKSKNSKVKITKRNQKSKSRKMTKRSKSRKMTKRSKSRKMKGGNNNCEYLKVEGMNLPDLKIDQQMALLNSNCKPSTEQTFGDHPHISK
jgi:hypothetical protein